jgi:hypothetical protein
MGTSDWMVARNSQIVSTPGNCDQLPRPTFSLGMATIDKFQKDPDIFIFLISTLAGGTGLNLTAANKVVVFGECPMTMPRKPTLKGACRPQLEYVPVLFARVALLIGYLDPAHDLQAMDRCVVVAFHRTFG